MEALRLSSYPGKKLNLSVFAPVCETEIKYSSGRAVAHHRLPACKAMFIRYPLKITERGAGDGRRRVYLRMVSAKSDTSKGTVSNPVRALSFIAAVSVVAYGFYYHQILTSGLSVATAYLLLQPTWITRCLQKLIPKVLFLKPTEDKVVALTIDDAPHQNITSQILDVLLEFDCKATFFVIGENLDNNPGLVDRMHNEGHEVGNHTMRDFPSWRLSHKEFGDELRELGRRIEQFFTKDPTTGKPIKWFRPGHGFFTKDMIAEAEAQEYRVALGSLFPYDTLFKGQSWLLSKYLLWRIHPGAVIVLHDREPQKDQTAKVLRKVLPELKDRGYAVVTLSDLYLRPSVSKRALVNCCNI
ncbi:hypothetical protein Mapa_017049 [Marchantia paleacea]|nr:hypothetical protein Mapa_017049 [Marchantia paleacea]